MSDIWQDIKDEREYQRDKWGGDDHDDQHTTWDWITFITKHCGRAIDPGSQEHFDIETYRKQMVRVAALSVAAIEWVDRNFDLDE